MTVVVEWSWWTFVATSDGIVSGGRIVELDPVTRRLVYLRPTDRHHAPNPHPVGSDAYQDWLFDTVETACGRVWVDTERRVVQRVEDLATLERGETPPGFLELSDGDPEAYFRGERPTLATYLPEDS